MSDPRQEAISAFAASQTTYLYPDGTVSPPAASLSDAIKKAAVEVGAFVDAFNAAMSNRPSRRGEDLR